MADQAQFRPNIEEHAAAFGAALRASQTLSAADDDLGAEAADARAWASFDAAAQTPATTREAVVAKVGLAQAALARGCDLAGAAMLEAVCRDLRRHAATPEVFGDEDDRQPGIPGRAPFPSALSPLTAGRFAG